MENTVEQLIANRSYNSLNEAEKAMVSELCANEQEFNQMKLFFASMAEVTTASQFEPSADLKTSLDSVFAAKHGGIGARLTPRKIPQVPVAAAKVIPFYQQTWARVAAGVILIAGVFSVWQLAGNNTFKAVKDQELAKAEVPAVDSEPEFKSEAPVKKENKPIEISGLYIEPQVKSHSVKVQQNQPESETMYEDVKAESAYSPSPAVYEAAALDSRSEMEKDVAFTKMISGRDADLYPDGKKYAETLNLNASAVSASEEDLLSYIVPAF